MARKLPVYLLLDCSGSMAGEPIRAVRAGVEALHANLLGNPMAMDTASLAVITFANDAEEKIPLTPLLSFEPPEIEAGGLTAMGAALKLLANCIDRDVQRKHDESQRGDWRPLVFLLTDGYPTDDQTPDTEDPTRSIFDVGVARIRGMRFGRFVACAAGRNVNTAQLQQITDDVILMEELTPEKLGEFFQWVSDSVVAPDQAAPALPQGFVDLTKH